MKASQVRGMEPFELAVARFRKFLIEQHYPPNLLWLRPEDVVFWGLRYYFPQGDASERELLRKRNMKAPWPEASAFRFRQSARRRGGRFAESTSQKTRLMPSAG
jgi:hypothetical protein